MPDPARLSGDRQSLEVTGDALACPHRLGCGWFSYRKHRPHEGLRPEHTIHDPAKYLPGVDIRAVETQTVSVGQQLRKPPGKSEYLRATGSVIGYDKGKNATWSFAECSGGPKSHGRPMASSNHKVPQNDRED